VALVDSIPALRLELERRADPARAGAMAAYMRGQFEFFGVGAAGVRAVSASFVAAGRHARPDELLDAAERLWAGRERELQYVGVRLLRRWVRKLTPDALPRIEQLVRTKSWWDTVDALASHVVGGLVAGHRELAPVMDVWIGDDDRWIRRAAILHQLTFGGRTDADRLYRSVDRCADDPDFFIRKACGWALRSYGRTDPDGVRDFVAGRHDRLSALTRREALKHLSTPG
jgi:3-methyladenine DNA glycosylase AlkD